MKIGIFTDTYRPSLNGIVYVTEILRRNFEAAGHEVFIFAPASSLSGKDDQPDSHIIRFPAVGGIVYDDFNSSLFFPPKVLNRIKEIDLDVIHFLTPGPVGLMAMLAAHKLGKPIVAEYCTDLFEYVEHYPLAAPGIFALGAVLPFTFRPSRSDLLDMIKAARPRLGTTKWNREMVKHLITVIHSHCDAVIAHSRKSARQMTGWQNDDEHYKIDIIPTGVDPIPAATPAECQNFRLQWGIGSDDEVMTYVGRLSPEKNLDMLIEMTAELIKWRPNAKLLYVGDFAEYRPKLEEKAAASPAADHIIFTGRLPREELGTVFGVTDVFVFPSLTDTQSLALHEAAGAGLPIVMIDEPVTEVVHDGVNGYFCKNDPIDMAAKVLDVLEDTAGYKKMSQASLKVAKQFSEKIQCDKILGMYDDIIRSKKAATQAAHE
ncbi:MAG TPA: glycosyltransferase [Candidatus Saccharimonadales bacterium]|nr:glycosyltransferase [Candidatus Saccharimonadales bacterium]